MPLNERHNPIHPQRKKTDKSLLTERTKTDESFEESQQATEKKKPMI
jgi:hypothetical protein